MTTLEIVKRAKEEIEKAISEENNNTEAKEE